MSGISANTLVRSSGDPRSRSASELLLTQKTKLPCLSTVCLWNTDTHGNDKFGIIQLISYVIASIAKQSQEFRLPRLPAKAILRRAGLRDVTRHFGVQARHYVPRNELLAN